MIDRPREQRRRWGESGMMKSVKGKGIVVGETIRLRRIGMKWQNYKKKYIFHRPPLLLFLLLLLLLLFPLVRSLQPSAARRFVPRNDFASRAEIFVPSSVAHDAMSHGSFFSFPAIVFVRCGADQRGNISSFEGFLMYSRISVARGTSRCELSRR